jgi:hypothetical protein
MHRMFLPLPLVLAVACAPHQATVTGTWTSWLAASTSATVDAGDLTLNPDNASSVPDGVTGLRLDCREEPTLRTSVKCTNINPQWFTWLLDDGYYILKGPFDPWRSEAIITAESDLQLTFHTDLWNGEDFRVVFAIDPAFRPRQCRQVDGKATLVDWDGADWVDEWSADEDGMYIYYLNAGAYQLNPYDSSEYWTLPPEWLSGIGEAKFAGDEEFSHASDYGEYQGDTPDSFFLALDPAKPDMETYAAVASNLRSEAATWSQELIDQGQADDTFKFKVEDNMWRPIDSSSAGLDGWLSLESSWVRLNKRGPFEPGDSVSGDFQFMLEGYESISHLLVTGTFDIPDLREDRWGYPILEDQKREENNTSTCE